jgi:outer membrane protein TolC
MLLIFAGMSMAQDLPVVTLRQCLEQAVANSHSMNKARLESREASAKTKEIRASALPQVDAAASLNDNLAIPVVMLPGEIIGQPGEMIPAELGVQYDASASLQLSQTIFNPALFTGIKVARNAEELMQLKTQLTKEELIYNVAAVYFDILHSEQQLKSVRGNIALQDSLYTKTKLRVEQDLTREIDLNRIKVNITGLKVQQENLQAVVGQQKRYLQTLANMPLDRDFLLDGAIIRVIALPEIAGNEEAIFAGKTEIAMLNQQKELNRLELKATQMQYVPTLSFVASGAYQFQSEAFRLGNADNWFKSALVGLRLNIPLFDGTSKRHKISQIRSQQMMLDNETDYVKLSLSMERKNSLTELNVSFQSVRMQEENLRLAEQNYEQSRLLYQEGLYNVTDLLQTENSLHEAQIAHLSEIIRYKKAELNLMKAEGRLEELIGN